MSDRIPTIKRGSGRLRRVRSFACNVNLIALAFEVVTPRQRWILLVNEKLSLHIRVAIFFRVNIPTYARYRWPMGIRY